jgi:hypothetical protein
VEGKLAAMGGRMSREDLITYKMMQRLHETPEGLMTADFLPLSSSRVHNYLIRFVPRGWVTLHKVGSLNRYTVNEAQWAMYVARPKAHVHPKKKSAPGDGSVYGKLMELASRSDGLDCSEQIRGLTRDDVSIRLSKLGVKGRLIGVDMPLARRRYFMHQADADAYRVSYVPPQPPPPVPRAVKQPKIQSAKAIKASFRFTDARPKDYEATKLTARAKWLATPPHLPYDEAGRPLFKVTVCPGFTSQPTRSNTHPM